MPQVEPADVTPVVAGSAPRVCLVAQDGSADSRTIECRRVVTLIGSRRGCKVKLAHRHISAVHLAIVNNGTEVYAIDLASERGTRLNGLKMECERLTDGDMLEVRPFLFRVDIENREQVDEEDTHPISLDPTPAVVAIEHLATGRILKPTRELCTVGRRSGCDIIVEDRKVSRVHILLLTYFGHPAVIDLLSHNQTLINDRSVQFRVLANNDVIAIGDTRFGVRLLGSMVAERAANGSSSGSTKPIVRDPARDHIDIGADETTFGQRSAPKTD